jgi:hypothetical protein
MGSEDEAEGGRGACVAVCTPCECLLVAWTCCSSSYSSAQGRSSIERPNHLCRHRMTKHEHNKLGTVCPPLFPGHRSRSLYTHSSWWQLSSCQMSLQ